MTKKVLSLFTVFLMVAFVAVSVYAVDKTATTLSKKTIPSKKMENIQSDIAIDKHGSKFGPSKVTGITQEELYLENFDTGAPDWAFEDLWSEPLWHVTTTGAFSGNSYWCGDELLGGYSDYTTAGMTTPPIDLSGTTAPMLTFMHDYSVEEPSAGVEGYDGWDAVTVMLSTDGTNFEVITGDRAYDMQSSYGFHLSFGLDIPAWGGSTGGFVEDSFDLSAYAGQTVWIMFVLSSDEAFSTRDDPGLFGWRVDDIEVADGDNVIFFDDAGDANGAQMDLLGPGGPNQWHLTTDAAVSAPNSAGCFDPATGDYACNMKASLTSPPLAIDVLPPNTGELLATVQLKGVLDPTAYGTDGLNVDLYIPEYRVFADGAWGWWTNYGFFGGIPEDFAQIEYSVSDYIGVADSVQFRFLILTQPDGAVVSPANCFIDDFVLTAIPITDDLQALSVECPFPVSVDNEVTLELNVLNVGANPQTNFTWQGQVFDAAGNVVSLVVGQFADTLEQTEEAAIPALTAWTPAAPGLYTVKAWTRLAGDQSAANDTTVFLSDDSPAAAAAFGIPLFSTIYVGEHVVFAANLNDLPADPGTMPLESEGLMIKSNSDPGVVTWHTGAPPVVAANLGGEQFPGALVLFDSLGRAQDEELIIPNIDCSYLTSNVILNFKGIGIYGFTYSKISVGVSVNAGASWVDVFQKVRGVDPQTGSNYGGPAFNLGGLIPANIDITPFAAGRSNVWVRVRYEGYDDGDFCLWKIMISGDGLLGAELLAADDVPNDQGKQVRLNWSASPNDGMLDGVPISVYGVWRGVVGGEAAQGAKADITEVENRQAMISNIKDLAPGTRFMDAETGDMWDFVGTVLAHEDEMYNFVAPTLEDGVEYPFMVSAHTKNPSVFANSNIVNGMSEDNLPPEAPGNLVATAENGTVLLTWGEPTNEEPALYSIYRSETSGSYPEDPIATTAELEFRDDTVDREITVYYVVTATDYADNEGDKSNEAEVLPTGLDEYAGSAVPTEYSLSQNYPNPFNPTTLIQYQLPEAGEVTLKVLNSLGQEVRTLISGEMSAGYHHINWDGRDNSGNVVSNGIYLYRIKAGNYVDTKKMVFMK